MRNKQGREGESFLSLLVVALKKIGSLMPGAEQILIDFKWSWEDIEVVNDFTDLLAYSEDGEFINWLFSRLIH